MVYLIENRMDSELKRLELLAQVLEKRSLGFRQKRRMNGAIKVFIG
jgi:hypothetical protein